MAYARNMLLNGAIRMLQPFFIYFSISLMFDPTVYQFWRQLEKSMVAMDFWFEAITKYWKPGIPGPLQLRD